MRSNKGNILYAAVSLFMFISAFYPWNSFLAHLLSVPPLSLSAVVFTCIFSCFLFSLFRRRFRGIIFAVPGYMISVFAVTTNYCKLAATGISFPQLFSDNRLKGILLCFLLLFFTSVIWISSYRIMNGENSRKTSRIRFDCGTAFFLLLFLIKFIIKLKGGGDFNLRKQVDWFVIYLFSGLVMLSFFHLNGNSGGKIFSDSMKKGFILFLFMLSVLLFSFGILFHFTPELEKIALSGTDAAGSVAVPLENGLITVIRFLMDLRYREQVISELSSGSAPGISMGTPGGGVSDKIIIAGFLFFIMLSAFYALILFIRKLLRIIHSGKKERGKYFINISGFIKYILKIVSFFILTGKKNSPAVICFTLLKIRGRTAGIVYRNCETPLEYGKRLSSRCVYAGNEIMYISHVFSEYIYGGITPSGETAVRARRYILKIMNPFKKSRNKAVVL